MTRNIVALILTAGLCAVGTAWAQPIIDAGEETRIETLTGERVPTAIVLEQFAIFAQSLLDADPGHADTPWQRRVLAPLGLEPGSRDAVRLEKFARHLSAVFAGEWQPSARALAEKSVFDREQSDFQRARLSRAAVATADLVDGLEKSGRSALAFFDYLDRHIRPHVSTLVIGTPEEWSAGDPTGDFVRQWQHYDLELARLIDTEETRR